MFTNTRDLLPKQCPNYPYNLCPEVFILSGYAAARLGVGVLNAVLYMALIITASTVKQEGSTESMSRKGSSTGSLRYSPVKDAIPSDLVH